jgi:hypothetical protein
MNGKPIGLSFRLADTLARASVATKPTLRKISSQMGLSTLIVALNVTQAHGALAGTAGLYGKISHR